MLKKRRHLLISIFIITVIFAGCSPKESGSVDLYENYPEGVENGDVSKEYFHDLMGYFLSNANYRDDFTEFIGEDDYYTQSRTEEFKELIMANSIKINSYKTMPVTDVEKEIDYYFREAILQNEKLNKTTLKELKTEEPVSVEFYDAITSILEDQNIALDLLHKVLLKYKIFEE
ncbi:hypothetical protein [Sporosarcina sp. HYO08]|uniref:hypothetical protein n=1 Tax=Sporosarcina sp. HYO08 TaxID=1759557 RepID=UPI0007979393|nr:hypothetical protein [Sporosarcina sp. HYO08]KXH82073.1 hypothetical protein AU377_07425 [Sporosarcina sp. HYO08]